MTNTQTSEIYPEECHYVWQEKNLSTVSQPTLAAPPHSEQQEPAASSFACVSGQCPDKRECNAARACLYATAQQPSQEQDKARNNTLREAASECYRLARVLGLHGAERCAESILRMQSTGSEG